MILGTVDIGLCVLSVEGLSGSLTIDIEEDPNMLPLEHLYKVKSLIIIFFNLTS